MRRISQSFILYSLLVSSVLAQEPLLFIVNDPGSAPYLFYDRQKESYAGVIPDILQGLIDTQQLSVRFVSNSRKRTEEQVYQAKADMMMLSKAWLRHPDKVIATIPVHMHRSYLYRSTPFPEKFSLSALARSELLCTRKGYVYPNLQPYIENKRLIRVDSSNHLSMMKMLFKKRCDYVIMNEYNALNVINSLHFKQQQLFQMAEPISMVELNIILRPQLMRVKHLLDKHIEQLKAQGEIKRLLDKYTLYKTN